MSSPYGPVVLEHFRRPRNRGTLVAPTMSQEGVNPLCGDRVKLELRIEGDIVREARFSANACAICVAAASILTELIRDAPLEDIGTLTVDDLLASLKADIPRARVQCVRLPLTVLHTGLMRLQQRAAEDDQ
ncbi:MAG TPA: iron-sulfur cluster assembly scaffold protein [Gemmatimonadaceae bacterium]|nr:iron-sulfur cluster assembly scaffold protein [Gemmatimonadaceae bacterium]